MKADSKTMNELGVDLKPLDPQVVYLTRWSDDGMSVWRNPGVKIIMRDYTVKEWMPEEELEGLPVDEDGNQFEERVISRG